MAARSTYRREEEPASKDYFSRLLHYNERQSGWYIFRSIYWSIYLLLIAVLLIYYGPLGLSLSTFLGLSIFIFSIMFIIFGFTQSLHHKLMKRYA
ncbi:MAG: hypothetical protein QXL16_02490 [Candidatus Micrarchaeaceae archaeon]